MAKFISVPTVKDEIFVNIDHIRAITPYSDNRCGLRFDGDHTITIQETAYSFLERAKMLSSQSD